MAKVLPRKRFAVADVAIFIFAIALAIASILFLRKNDASKYATVTTDSGSFVLDLSVDSVHEFKSNGYSFKAEIKDGEISVIEADCPDCICKNSPAIGKNSGVIVCLPAKMIISCDTEEGGNENADAVIP